MNPKKPRQGEQRLAPDVVSLTLNSVGEGDVIRLQFEGIILNTKISNRQNS
jgi:hypothetical protein